MVIAFSPLGENMVFGDRVVVMITKTYQLALSTLIMITSFYRLNLTTIRLKASTS